MSHLVRVFTMGLLLVSVGGCGVNSPPTMEEGAFEVAAGTLNYSDNAGASFMFVFNLDEVPSEGLEVAISGPDSWNGGEEIRRIYSYETAGRKATWLNVFQGSSGEILDVVSGEYSVSASIEGVIHAEEVVIEKSDQLAKPQGLVAAPEGSSTVSVTWEAVAGAESYLVELFATATTEGAFVYVDGPSANLTGLALTQGEEYRVGVTALTADFSPGAARALPGGAFNTSFASVRFTAE
jgi:hypothetical protein